MSPPPRDTKPSHPALPHLAPTSALPLPPVRPPARLRAPAPVGCNAAGRPARARRAPPGPAVGTVWRAAAPRCATPPRRARSAAAMGLAEPLQASAPPARPPGPGPSVGPRGPGGAPLRTPRPVPRPRPRERRLPRAAPPSVIPSVRCSAAAAAGPPASSPSARAAPVRSGPPVTRKGAEKPFYLIL